jgi:hypothetical protein
MPMLFSYSKFDTKCFHLQESFIVIDVTKQLLKSMFVRTCYFRVTFKRTLQLIKTLFEQKTSLCMFKCLTVKSVSSPLITIS